jgi:hypothetical protein
MRRECIFGGESRDDCIAFLLRSSEHHAMMTDDEHCPVLPQSQPQGREPGRVVVGACGRPDADAMCLPCTVVSGSLALNGWWLLVLGPACCRAASVGGPVQSNPIGGFVQVVGLLQCRLLAPCVAILLRAGPAASARVDRGEARPAGSTLASRGQPMGDCTLRTAVCRGKVRLERPVGGRDAEQPGVHLVANPSQHSLRTHCHW